MFYSQTIYQKTKKLDRILCEKGKILILLLFHTIIVKQADVRARIYCPISARSWVVKHIEPQGIYIRQNHSSGWLRNEQRDSLFTHTGKMFIGENTQPVSAFLHLVTRKYCKMAIERFLSFNFVELKNIWVYKRMDVSAW